MGRLSEEMMENGEDVMIQRVITILSVLFILCGCDTGGGGVVGVPRPEGQDLQADMSVPVLHQDDVAQITVTVTSNGTETVVAPFSVILCVYEDASHTVEFCPPFTWEQTTDLSSSQVVIFDASLAIALSEPLGLDLYFVATVDYLDEIDEPLEDNNEVTTVSPIALPRMPDLTVSSFVVPSTMPRTVLLDISATIRNDGELAAIAPFTLEYMCYWDAAHTQPMFAPFEVLIEDDLASGASYVDDIYFTAELADPLGPIYFVVTIDTFNAVIEKDETNNSAVASATITPQPMPDLTATITNLPSAVYANTPFNASFQIRNSGAAASAATNLEVSFSDLSVTWMSYLGNVAVPALSAGQSWTYTTTPVFYSSVPSDSYYLWVYVDKAGVVPESNENNNLSGRTFFLY